MKLEEILSRLSEIRTLVEGYATPDGSVEVNPQSVYIATEFCLEELKRALEKGAEKQCGID